MLQALAGIIIFLLFMPGLSNLWDMGATRLQQRQAAEHLQFVTKASAQYVRKHQTTLLAQSSATSGPTITVSDLVTDKLLPVGFRERNVWGQVYQIHVRQPETNALQAIVLTSGGRTTNAKKFANITIPGAAAMLGGAGGYIPSGVIPGQSAGQLLGAGGGWSINLSSLGIASPGAGHLGALSSFDSSSLGQDQLYRVAVPGNPELNAMQTELDMTDHAIRGVSELQFTEREITDEACTTPEEQGRVFLDKNQGLYLCRNNSLEVIGDTGNSAQLREATVAKNGDIVKKPLCPTGTGTTPMIFTAPAIAEAGPEAPPMSSLQTWATSLSDTQWRVQMRVLTSNKTLNGADGDGWVYPGDNYNRIMVFTTCAKAATP